MWSIGEVVEIDLYQSGVLSRQSLKCLPESYLASFSGKVSPGAPGRLAKVCWFAWWGCWRLRTVTNLSAGAGRLRRLASLL